MRRPSPLFFFFLMSRSNFPGPVDLWGLAHIFHNIDTTKSNFRAILFL
nr:MAG TPA: hypothetical protein [Caudoviricetes sp.]